MKRGVSRDRREARLKALRDLLSDGRYRSRQEIRDALGDGISDGGVISLVDLLHERGFNVKTAMHGTKIGKRYMYMIAPPETNA